MVSKEDSKALCGILVPKYPVKKYLSKFILGEYLSLNKLEYKEKDTATAEMLYWETFEKDVGSLSTNTLQEGKAPHLLQDAIVVLCTDSQSEHWSLLAILPKKKLVLFLDRLTSGVVKPIAALLLKELDNKVDIGKEKFSVNKAIPMTVRCLFVYVQYA